MVRHGQIDSSVAVEVPGHDRARNVSDRIVDGGLERPVSVAHQDRDVAGVGIRDGQVELPVAAEIPAAIATGLSPTV